MSRVISTAMPVGEIVTRKPIWVDRDTTILGASNLMRCLWGLESDMRLPRRETAAIRERDWREEAVALL
jgi:hypothetical protein